MPALFRFRNAVTEAIFIFLLYLLTLPCAAAEPSLRLGLWIEAEGVNQPFRSSSEFERYLSFIGHEAFTDLYCQVYRHGRSWFPSMMADDEPYRAASQAGIDPLRRTLDHAHARGRRVHAWVNTLRIAQETVPPLLAVIGPDAALVDSSGNSLLNYDADGNPPGKLAGRFMLETPGVWLDASDPRVRQYIVETIRDLIVAYPDLDGIHLDMTRMPFSLRKPGTPASAPRPEFGFGRGTIRRFYALSGRRVPLSVKFNAGKLRNNHGWSAWQRAQVTLLVFEIRELLNKLAPEMELSAAVIASRDRSYFEAKQDWPTWVQGGLVDTVLPMSYTKDNAVLEEQSEHAVRVAGGEKVVMGLGAWLMPNDPQKLARQGKIAIAAGASGVTLFSYSNMVGAGDLPLLNEFYRLVFSAAKQPLKDKVRNN